MENYAIPAELLIKIATYLDTKPHNEVFLMMRQIQTLQKINILPQEIAQTP